MIPWCTFIRACLGREGLRAGCITNTRTTASSFRWEHSRWSFSYAGSLPTEGLVNELYLSERNRRLVTIPKLVVHAVQNVGNVDPMFIKLPIKPYSRLNPDTYRISLDSTEIAFQFDREPDQ